MYLQSLQVRLHDQTISKKRFPSATGTKKEDGECL